MGKLPEDAQSVTITLKDALQSAPVQQLMRTPLQCHIMAVIIRDGGRPPERRWGLYNTFYETIRKREINRRLPERAIADLLSREDILLRTVHNRMGLLLHARAEQSEGASTSVNREEFEDLVRRTVSELRDFDSEQVANNVSRATRDRLVLLSTPEDGQLIRFDIRQLQEFFAGEQMYYGIRVDLLPDRLRRIGDDAHWREVIHFTISALVEQNRITEIAIITQFLESLDDGTGYSRLFRRRLACGALAAKKLLCDGVLEQDKRLRQAFERTFDTIGTWVNNSIFDILNAPTQSRRWILDLMWSRLSEGDSSESAGALALLLLGLENEDPRLSQAIDKLIAGRAEFQTAVLSLFNQGPVQWDIERLIKRILDDKKWKRLTAPALQEIHNSLSQFNFDDEEETTNELQLLRLITDDRFALGTPAETVEVANISIVRYSRELVLNAIAKYKCPTDNAGEFNVDLNAIVHWTQNPCLSTYQSLRQRIGFDEAAFKSLFGSTYDNIIPDSKEVLSLNNQDEFGRYFDTWKREVGYERFSYTGPRTTPDSGDIPSILRKITSLIDKEPILCQWCLSIHDWIADSSVVFPDDFQELAKRLWQHPNLLARSHGLWGRVLKATKPTPVERADFLATLSSEPISWIGNVSAFPLRLPEESGALKIVCDLLGAYASHRRAIEDARQMVRGFVSSTADLEAILQGANAKNTTQAHAALLLFMLSGDSSKVMTSHRQSIIDAIVLNPKLIRSLIGILALLNLLHQEEFQSLAGEALEKVRGTDEWYSLEVFFEYWREVSRAPITTSSTLDEYLAWS